MEITIREKNQGPTVGIKKNNETVLESGQTPVAAAPAPEAAAATARSAGYQAWREAPCTARRARWQRV